MKEDTVINPELVINEKMTNSGFFVGVFRRGNKPSVLPREEKRAERQ